MNVEGHGNSPLVTTQNSATGISTAPAQDQHSASPRFDPAEASCHSSSGSEDSTYSCSCCLLGTKHFDLLFNQKKFALTPATLSPVWRTCDRQDSYTFALASPEAITDAMAQEIIANAKAKFQAATGHVIHDNRGSCYLVADDLENFFSRQGMSAKCVRVVPSAGGADHYFVVIRRPNGAPIVVDATWRQFYKSGELAKVCLAGTLPQIRELLSRTQLTVDLHALYAAGTSVVNDWDNYSCFS